MRFNYSELELYIKLIGLTRFPIVINDLIVNVAILINGYLIAIVELTFILITSLSLTTDGTLTEYVKANI